MKKDKYWFVLYTKPRHEFKAAAQLESIEIDYYLPTVTTLKQWSDRKKKVTEPVFKSYIFICASEKERLNSLEQNAIVSTVSFQGTPARVPEVQIESLRKMLAEDLEILVTDTLGIGELVRVVSGPFNGIEGIIYEHEKNGKMLGITIDLLNRSVSVKMPASSVTKILKK